MQIIANHEASEAGAIFYTAIFRIAERQTKRELGGWKAAAWTRLFATSREHQQRGDLSNIYIYIYIYISSYALIVTNQPVKPCVGMIQT